MKSHVIVGARRRINFRLFETIEAGLRFGFIAGELALALVWNPRSNWIDPTTINLAHLVLCGAAWIQIPGAGLAQRSAIETVETRPAVIPTIEAGP